MARAADVDPPRFGERVIERDRRGAVNHVRDIGERRWRGTEPRLRHVAGDRRDVSCVSKAQGGEDGCEPIERRTDETEDPIEAAVSGRARKNLAADHAGGAREEQRVQLCGLSPLLERTIVVGVKGKLRHVVPLSGTRMMGCQLKLSTNENRPRTWRVAKAGG